MPLDSQEETVTGSFSIVQISAVASFFMLPFTLFSDKTAKLIMNGYNKLASTVAPHQYHSFVYQVLQTNCGC